MPDTGLSFVIDEQVAPGTALNREAYLMYQMKSGHYLKAGKMFVPYGIRLEDDAKVTAGGNVNLTPGIPIEIEEIEDLMNS